MNVQEFLEKHNQARLCGKDKWVVLSEVVCEHKVAIKSFNNWVQVLRVEGPCLNFRDSGLIDCTVKAYKEYLSQALKPLENRVEVGIKPTK